MKILVCDGGDLAEAFAKILFAEGHDVYAANDHFGTSMYATTLGYRADFAHVLYKKWDLVVCPLLGQSKQGIVDEFRYRGIPTIGAGSMGWQMEQKNVGRAVFQDSGLRCPRWQAFDSTEAAIKAIESGVFNSVVVKFSDYGKAMRTTVCPDPDDAVTVLRGETGPVVLEEIVRGIEVALACYFDGTRFIPSVTTFEHKHFYPGRLGTLTGEMGTSLFYDPTPQMMALFESLLKSELTAPYLSTYRGFLDINCIMTETGEFVPLEFTCRFGIPQTGIMMALLMNDETRYGEFLLSVANGQADASLIHHSNKFAVGVNLVTPDFPWSRKYPDLFVSGRPISGVERLSCQYVTRGVGMRNGRRIVTGPWVLCAVGLGDTMEQARRMVYAEISKVSFQEMVYREDIGATWPLERDALVQFGGISRERYAMDPTLTYRPSSS